MIHRRLQRARQDDRLVVAGRATRPREGEQAADQPLHATRRQRDVLEELLTLLVELAGVAAQEQVGEAADRAQGLLQVVRGRRGELLELLVRGPAVGQVAGDLAEAQQVAVVVAQREDRDVGPEA